MEFKPEYFGKYILLEKLATGGMAEVYLAKVTGAENVSKFVAIKRILPQFSQNQEFIEMFKEEAKIAVNLNHSNVVSIFDFDVQSGQFYIVMEFVEGRNLRQILNKIQKLQKRMTIDQIAYIINEVARGLNYAHRCVDSTTGRPLNITHRDMSPQNIMVSFEGEVKIVDFGIAKAESKIENTRAGTLKGKFGYMSPEQAEGLDVDARTDIFSLGIVLWELLAQERLFMANNEINTLRKIRDCVIPSLRKIDANIPAELERITNKALTRDRNLRYQNADEFHRDLNRFLNRHYPDFNPQDFAGFIKSLYSEERAESRQKMIEYAKIQAPNGADKESSVPDVTYTLTDTHNKPNNKGLDVKQPMNLVAEDKLKSTKDIDFNLNNKKKDLFKNNTKADGTGTNLNKSNTNIPTFGTNTQYTATRSQNSSSGVAGIILFLLMAGGAFYIYQEKPAWITGEKQKPTSNVTTSNAPAVPTPGQAQNASTSPSQPPEPTQLRLMVQSTPSDAKISIDGVDTTYVTPHEVVVPANKQIKISLTRNGYDRSDKDVIVTRDGETYTVLLEKANSGYVNITVRPGGADIYIDRKKISLKPPIEKYPIPAGKNVMIQAYDPVTKTTDARIVNVRRDVVQQVDLFLRKPNTSRQPSKSK